MVTVRLKGLRQAAGITCRELERLAGLKPTHVWAIERRGTDPELATIRALAAVFGCTVGWLADAEGKRPTDAAVRKAVEAARQKHAELYAQN